MPKAWSSSTIFIGLERSEPEAESITSLSCKAAMGVNMRMQSPDSPQSSGAPGLSACLPVPRIVTIRNFIDLNEMVEMHYLGKVPEAPYGYKIVYDATAGSIKVVKQ